MINGHGNNLYDYSEKIRSDFSSNIAFNNQSATILEHLKKHLDVITNYPDPNARLLTEKLARHHGVSSDQILVTNGSAEAFYLAAHLFQNAKTLIGTPAFAEYEDACRVFKHSISFFPLSHVESEPLPLDPIRTALSLNAVRTLWIGTPNNPDGMLTAPETLQAICQEYPNTYLIIDRAYSSLSESISQQTTLCEPNLISIYSLTKTFAIPGLRLGYILATPRIISRLSKIRPPWGVNALALEAGSFILDHYNILKPALDELIQESRFLQTALSKIPELEVIPSNCNFFLCKLLRNDSSSVKEQLVTQYSILIRDCSNFRGLDNTYIRISTQTREKNEALIRALKNILAQ